MCPLSKRPLSNVHPAAVLRPSGVAASTKEPMLLPISRRSLAHCWALGTPRCFAWPLERTSPFDPCRHGRVHAVHQGLHQERHDRSVHGAAGKLHPPPSCPPSPALP